MAWNIVPLDTWGDQEIYVTVDVSGENIPLRLRVRYNTESECWIMSVSDGISNQMLADSIPLVTGNGQMINILRQHDYLGIGEARVIPVSDKTRTEIPRFDNLETEFALVWGDADGQ